MVEDTSISIDMQPIIISLDFGQLSEKCRTNNKINNILKKLKEKESTSNTDSSKENKLAPSTPVPEKL